MNTISLKSFALGVLLGAAALFSIGAAPDRGTVQYEYKFLSQFSREQRYTLDQFEQSVNEFAKDGWEVVGMASENGPRLLLRRPKR